MARTSRSSSKKQPAFDPSELTDLIFSPAVGTGVGSHLLGTTRPTQAEGEKDTAEQNRSPTVDISLNTTVDMYYYQETDNGHVTTVGMSNASESKELRAAFSVLERLPAFAARSEPVAIHMSTVAMIDTPTVVESTTVPPSESLRESHALPSDPSTVAISQSFRANFDGSAGETQAGKVSVNAPAVAQVPAEKTGTELTVPNGGLASSMPSKSVVLWITEHGDLVPEGRIKRIRLAQDVINSAEESVYDTLWTAKTVHSDARESFRIVQAGYDYLGKKTRLSKKTIQRIVAKLIDKDFIAIEQQADIYQRTSTVYRVFSYRIVLERHIKKGRCHVVKMGPGFSYVRPLSDPRPTNSPPPTTPTPVKILPYLSTVPILGMATVVNSTMSTPVKPTTETVAELDMTTVVRQTTSLLGTDALEQTTSSSALHQALSSFGAVDDEVIHRLTRSCKQQAPDCTDDEIVHFLEEKGSLIRTRDSRIHSPIGFLLTAVPKCFSGDAFRLFRIEQANRRKAEAAYEAKREAEIDEWRREQQARLIDPNVSEDDKHFIREYLGIV